jgi:MFS family permease
MPRPRLLSGKSSVSIGDAGGSRIGGDVVYGLIVAFTLTCTRVTTVLQLPKFLALMALLIGTAFNALAVPLFACLSDRWGRRPVLAFGLAGQASFIIE